MSKGNKVHSRPGTPKANIPGGQKAVEVIKGMADTALDIGKASTQLQTQTEALSAVSFESGEDPMAELKRLRRVLRQHDAEHGKRMEEVKRSLVDEIEVGSRHILEEVKRGLRPAIDEEVRYEMDAQISERIPVPLDQQAEETQEQLRIVNASLQNSRSRIANAMMDPSGLYDPISLVLTPEGRRSRYWPADLCSLFAYDLKSARMLVKEFGLVDSDQLHVNFQRFLAHIGARPEAFSSYLKS